MSWKLDNIDLLTYGVHVQKSSGLLDVAPMVDKSTDWLDLNGADYWQDLADVKYKDREITLNCWIKASGYASFKTQLQAFYDALNGSGKRLLKAPYLVTDLECYLEKPILLERKSRYVQALQIGVFNLTLTVPGDPDYHQLNIARYYSYDTVATVFTNDLKIHKTLQGDSYATCSFYANQKLDIQYWDRIDINSNGVVADMFTLSSEPEFKKVAENKYRYTLRFNHTTSWLSHTKLLDYNHEADFYSFANLEELVDLILWNHSRSGYNKFIKGSIPQTEYRNHKFSGEDCLQALRRVCQEYKLEYEFEFTNITTYQYRINIKEQVANDTGITLEYGKGNGLYELSRGAMLRDELCTILYAYGSSKNLKPDYRGGLTRLSFVGNPLKNNDGFDFANGDLGQIEHTVFFDDIFPRRTAALTSYEQKLPAELTASEKYAFPEGIYKIIDSTLDFNINSYMLGGLTPKVRMKTGSLSGFEFEIARYDDAEKAIYLVPFKDERGDIFPNATLSISAGDEYTLIDLDQPPSYVSAAENEVAAAATEYIAKHSIPRYPYVAKTHPAFIAATGAAFEVGDRVTIVDTDYNANGLFRISSLIYDVYKRTFELTLSDTAIIPNRLKNEMRISALERSLADTKKDTVESMRKEKETTGELRNRLLDPIDDKFAADRNVREESLDPRMLAYDAGVPQFSIKDALIESNVDGNEDKIKVNAGQLVIHNDPAKTLDRYGISKLKAGGGTYDPTRSWNIVETNFTLPSKAGYWLYAKLDLTPASTSCTLEVHEEHVEVKQDIETGFVIYKLAHISQGEEAAV